VTEHSGAPAAGNSPAHRERTWARTIRVSLSCVLVAGASISATLSAVVAPAGADQVSTLQAEAAQLSREMLLEQLQIGGYQQQYGTAMLRVQQDVVQEQQVRTAIQHDQQRVDHDRTVLRGAAVSAYENGGPSGGVTSIFSDQADGGSRTEYEHVLSSNVLDAVDRLRSDRDVLQAHQASLARVQAQDQASQAEAQALLQQAEGTEQQLQQQSSTVTGQLAVAVAQQQAAQAAAAAAAVAAASARARAAAAQDAAVQPGSAPASSPSTPTGGGAPPATAAAAATGGGTTVPALPPFLQCVVQAESSGNYQAVSPSGQYMGAFQFSQSTWNEAALLAGQPGLVNVPPDQATPAQQDDLAIALYNADGSQPWYDPCTSS
jgi:Transglycosylase-like domain